MMGWRYILADDLVHATAPCDAPVCSLDWVRVEWTCRRVTIRVRAGYAWDGCTFAPDLCGTRWASCLHDAIYQFAEEISAVTGWSVRRILRWADGIFRERMRMDGASLAVRLVYGCMVALVGYPFHMAARWLRNAGKTNKGEKTWHSAS